MEEKESPNKENFSDIEKQLIAEEFSQRYVQYRWEDETRSKFIDFYLVIYLAFFGLIGYLSEKTEMLGLFPYEDNPNIQFAIIFLVFSIIGTLWLISIISFRSIQLLEGRTIKDIKELSKFLMEYVTYPIDRQIPKTNKLIYSTTPLTWVVFILNEITFLISIWFFIKAELERWYLSPYISVVINVLCVIILIVYARFWRPKLKSLKDLDYNKIW